MEARAGDLLICDESQHGGFVIVAAVGHRLVAGPFKSLADALRTALEFADGQATLWHQQSDLRGRPLGPPVALPFKKRR